MHYALFIQTKFQHKHVCRRHCTSEPYIMYKFDTYAKQNVYAVGQLHVFNMETFS